MTLKNKLNTQADALMDLDISCPEILERRLLDAAVNVIEQPLVKDHLGVIQGCTVYVFHDGSRITGDGETFSLMSPLKIN